MYMYMLLLIILSSLLLIFYFLFLFLLLLFRLSLLWYHTIVRPFFALDGEQEDAGNLPIMRLTRIVLYSIHVHVHSTVTCIPQ